MGTRQSIPILVAALGVIVLGGTGCASKDIQAASDGGVTQEGSTQAGSQGTQSVSSHQSGQPGTSEEEIGVGAIGQMRSESTDDGQIRSSDLEMPLGGGSTADGGPGGAGAAGGDMAAGEGFGTNDISRSQDGVSSAEDFPGFDPGQSGSGQGALSGFEDVEPGQTPSEDPVQDGTLIAKAEPSESFESQLEALRGKQERVASGELQDVFFGYDSWRISREGRESLERNAAWLRANPSKRLTVEGHCDERGSGAYNLVLGEKRAKALRHYLIELGVSPERVAVVSYGKERPFCNARDEDCHQLNRRGHFVVKP